MASDVLAHFRPRCETREIARMTHYLARLRYGPGADGFEDLFEGLVRAPAHATLTVCHIGAHQRWFIVFADEEMADLYGVLAGRLKAGLATDGTDEADQAEKSLATNGTNDTDKAQTDELTEQACAADRSVSDDEMDALLTEEMDHEDETYAVKVQLADGTIVDTEIVNRFVPGPDSDAGGEDKHNLSIEVPGEGSFSVEWVWDEFEAFAELRRQLEPLGVRVLCFGARRDTWASNMQRDMGTGSFAYLLSYPRKDLKPMQRIFDYAPPETIGTVDEQAAYEEAWREGRAPSQK